MRAEPPDAWDRARDPGLDHRREVIDAAEQMLTGARAVRLRRNVGSVAAARRIVQSQANVARALLQELTPGDCDTVEICFLLAEAAELLEDDAATIRLLERASSRFPDDRRSTHALFQLAVAHAKLGQRDLELRAYGEYLARVEDPDDRYIALANRAESRFALGDTDAAIADYREAIALRPGRSGTLARLGLAFSLDRLGDLTGALREAKEAEQGDGLPSELEHPFVFFVPPYEREWYRALVEAGRAELATTPSGKRFHWELAGQFYELYVHAADPKDKAIPLAKSRAKLAAKFATRWKIEAKKLALPKGLEPETEGFSFPFPP